MKTLVLLVALLLASWEVRAQSIHKRAQEGDLEGIQQLLREQPQLRNAFDGAGRTPAKVAAAAGQVAVVDYFLGTGIRADETTPGNRTLLHEACANGRLEVVRLLVTKYRASLTVEDSRRWTAIHFACLKEPVEVLRFLLDQRANPNAPVAYGATPLHIAAGQKLSPHVALLLQRKAEVNKTDSSGRTALHVAAKNQDVEMAKLLLKAGARCGTKDQEGRTALDEALSGGAVDVAQVLEKTCGDARVRRKK